MNDVTTDSSPRALWVVREWLFSIWLANKPGLCHLRNTFWFSSTTSFSQSHCHFIYPEMETTVIDPLPSHPHWGKIPQVAVCLSKDGWVKTSFEIQADLWCIQRPTVSPFRVLVSSPGSQKWRLPGPTERRFWKQNRKRACVIRDEIQSQEQLGSTWLQLSSSLKRNIFKF